MEKFFYFFLVIFFFSCSAAVVEETSPPTVAQQWAEAQAEADQAETKAMAKAGQAVAAGRQYFSCLQASQEAIEAEKAEVASVVVPPTALIKIDNWGKDGISFIGHSFAWALKLQPAYIELWLGGEYRGTLQKKSFSNIPGCYLLDSKLSVFTDGNGIKEVQCPPR